VLGGFHENEESREVDDAAAVRIGELDSSEVREERWRVGTWHGTSLSKRYSVVMKALTFGGTGDIRYEEVADPRIEDDRDVIVRVEVAGLCGSDLHPYCGREKGLDVGTVMGHEFVGEIIDIGSAVAGLSVGNRVVAPFSTNCGECSPCRLGLTSRCERGQLFGWMEGSVGLHGGQAEIVRVPFADTSLVRVPEDLAADLALFAADILPTGLFSAEMGEVGPKTVVAVVGCGPVGLMAVVSARLRGAPRVFAIDSVIERLRFAAELGAEAIDRGEVNVVEAILEETHREGVDVVLEVVGSTAAARLAIDLVRPGGILATAGFHTEPHFAFSPGEAYDKNLTYRTGRCPARRFMKEALEILSREEARFSEFITHRLPLDEGPEAYRIFDKKLESCIKVALRT
jgi:threonine dehydrogenase-like Zn-dependent dehydrogenase